ncbi:MAG: radical SAM protein [Patescibacteria group bacterium]|jgi:DNA repair photolyase
MKIREIKSKTILTDSRLPEVNYCINPYVGCAHACTYCYARFMRRFTGHNNEKWGEFIDVKTNAAEIIEKQLFTKSKKGAILLGSVTDAYQPIEKKYQLTRSILEKIIKNSFPISILTKSSLVTRDIDLLQKINTCEVGITITMLNSKYSSIIEPRASSPQDRIKAIDELKKAGIKTYVFIGPILPGITDLDEIFRQIQNKVDFVMAESLNQKFGDWDGLIKAITNCSSVLLELYQAGFDKKYWDETEKKIVLLSKKYNIKLKGFYRH